MRSGPWSNRVDADAALCSADHAAWDTDRSAHGQQSVSVQCGVRMRGSVVGSVTSGWRGERFVWRGLCGEVCVRLEGTGGSKSAFLQAMCPISRLCEAVGADLIIACVFEGERRRHVTDSRFRAGVAQVCWLWDDLVYARVKYNRSATGAR